MGKSSRRRWAQKLAQLSITQEQNEVSGHQGKFFWITGLVATGLIALLQVNVVDMNWMLSAVLYVALGCMFAWATYRYGTAGMVASQKITSTALAFLVVILLGSWGTEHQFYRDHPPSADIAVFINDAHYYQVPELSTQNEKESFQDVLNRGFSTLPTYTLLEPMERDGTILTNVIIRNTGNAVMRLGRVSISAYCVPLRDCEIRGVTDGSRPFNPHEVGYDIARSRLPPYRIASSESHFTIALRTRPSGVVVVSAIADWEGSSNQRTFAAKVLFR